MQRIEISAGGGGLKIPKSRGKNKRRKRKTNISHTSLMNNF
jgi:hypothetical protein